MHIKQQTHKCKFQKYEALSLQFLKHKNILISTKKKVTGISTMNTCCKAEEFKGDQNEQT